jgi:hypothetical protein
VVEILIRKYILTLIYTRHDWDKKHKRKRRHVYELNQRVTDMVMDTFWFDSIPVIPSFGNNDVFPHNQIGGPEKDGDLLSFYEQIWRPWIPKDQRNTFKQGGYFMVQVAPRLHVLTLNTMYFYIKNHAIEHCHHLESPAYQQLVWFEAQLKQARSTQDRIYVIGHVPPSPRDYKGPCLTEYMRIASNYTDVIMGHFFAHLNMDHFLMFDGREFEKRKSMNSLLVEEDKKKNQKVLAIEDYDDDQQVHVTRNIGAYLDWLRDMYQDIDLLDDKRLPPNTQPPLVVIQVSPSILPVYNPAIRIYQYEINGEDIDDDNDDDHDDDDDDGDDEDELKPHGTLLSYSQYFANLTKWNHITAPSTTEKLEYELEYSTKEAYGMEDLTVESYFQFAKSMVEDNTEEGNLLWAKYRHHMLVKTEDFTAAN